MSRTNPTSNTSNPSTKWFEWDGINGVVCFFDKERQHPTKKDKDGKPRMGDCVDVPKTKSGLFQFIHLDDLVVAKGYSEKFKTWLYSNEIKDCRFEPLVVKWHGSNEVIANGFWKDIKDIVTSKTIGGQYHASIYLAYRPVKDQPLKIGNLSLKGGALMEWFNFFKKNSKDLNSKSVRIVGFTEHVNGAVKYRNPVFELADSSPAANAEADALDKELQQYLEGYFKRTRTAQAVAHNAENAQPDAKAGGEVQQHPGDASEETPPADEPPPVEEDDDVPF